MGKVKRPILPPVVLATFYVPVTLGARVAIRASCQEAAVAKLQAVLGTAYRYKRRLLIPLTEHMVLDLTRPVLNTLDIHNVEKELG